MLTVQGADEAPDLPEHSDQFLAVEEAMACAWSSGRIVRMLMDRFHISDRTAARRIKQVKDTWAKLSEAARPIRKAQLRAHYLAIIAAAHGTEPKQLGAAAAATKSLAALDGLDEPSEFRDRTERPRDLSKLTDAELVEAKRLAAKTEGSAG